MPGRKAVHTAKFDRCVSDCAKGQGGKIKGTVNCYAVCTASLGKEAIKKSHQKS